MAKEPHPPKSKKTNRPRKPPVEPLTAIEREAMASQEFDKAIVNLEEAETMAALKKAPGACAHSAYYAMHHAARAALLAAGGVGKRRDVPFSHEVVLEHYGKLVAAEGPPLGETGRHLARAKQDRTTADYGLSAHPTMTEAIQTTDIARAMVDGIQKRWKL